MTRVARLLIAVGLLISGVLLGLYGLFAIFYGGDSGGNGDTYVKVGSHEVDAGIVGAVALIVGILVIVLAAVVSPRRSRMSH